MQPIKAHPAPPQSDFTAFDQLKRIF
jgi:hypothetical protein